MPKRKKPSPQPVFRACYCPDWRGDKDDCLCFLFRGLSDDVLERVFAWLSAGGNLFTRYVIGREYELRAVNGGSVYHTIVKTAGHNPDFLSLSDTCLLIEARIQAECKCKIQKMKIDKFLNI